jgi:K+-transporting ATPase A subunit
MKTLYRSPRILIIALAALAESAVATQPTDVVTSDSNDNTAMGTKALYNLTTGANNTASGAGAMLYNTTGTNNTASGDGSLESNTAKHSVLSNAA